MEDADKEKTAFCTTEGLYQFKVMRTRVILTTNGSGAEWSSVVAVPGLSR